MLVGDGEDRPQTSRRSPRELGVADRCRFVGFQKSIRDWYAAFDALLLTSANEGTPVVAIEALAAERPVVATRAGGTGTVVGDGESGFLARGRRHGGAGRRLAELAGDPELRARLGARGAEDVAHALRDRPDGGRARGRLPPAARVKVLHVHKLTGISGSEGHLLALLPALRERGVDARFLGLDVPGSDAPRFYDALDAARRPAPPRPLRRSTSSPRLARDVVRAVRAERPDLVHTHLVHADVYGALAARADRDRRTSRPATTTTATCSAPSATSTAPSRAGAAADRDLGRRARLPRARPATTRESS